MGHEHLYQDWRLSQYAGIATATCSCGRMRFKVSELVRGIPTDPRLISQVALFNEAEEEKAAAEIVAPAVLPEPLPDPPSTAQPEVASGITPVPPRPDITGLPRGTWMKLIHEYYEANKAAIIADVDVIGEEATCTRWDIPQRTWDMLRAKLMPDKFQMPEWARRKKGKKCLTCVFAYEHDGQRWCSTKRCHSRIRANARPPFRPKTEETAEPGKTEGKVVRKYSKRTSSQAQTATEPTLKVLRVFQLPDGFPPFSDCHTPDVQVKWLEVYRDLALHQ